MTCLARRVPTFSLVALLMLHGCLLLDGSEEDDDAASSGGSSSDDAGFECYPEAEFSVEVSGWTIEPGGLELAKAAAEHHEETVWGELDDGTRCKLACAEAAGMLSPDHADYWPEETALVLDACSLVEPTDTEPGSVSCIGTRQVGYIC